MQFFSKVMEEGHFTELRQEDLAVENPSYEISLEKNEESQQPFQDLAVVLLH